MNTRFDVVLFDVDGTLMDSCEGIWESMRYAAHQLDIDLTGRDMTRYLGPTLEWIFTDMCGNSDKVIEGTKLYRQHYLQVGIHMSKPFEGVCTMLKALQRAGVQLCTATCKLQEQAEIVLDEHGLLSCFDYIGGASLDGKISTKAEVIADVVRQPQFAGKRVLMVGDRSDDVLGAKQCGIPVVGVAYGYAHSGELEEAGAERIFSDCIGLTNYILNQTV